MRGGSATSPTPTCRPSTPAPPRSRCRRCTRASASRASRPWPPAPLSLPPTAPRCPRPAAARPCWWIRTTRTRSPPPSSQPRGLSASASQPPGASVPRSSPGSARPKRSIERSSRCSLLAHARDGLPAAFEAPRAPLEGRERRLRREAGVVVALEPGIAEDAAAAPVGRGPRVPEHLAHAEPLPARGHRAVHLAQLGRHPARCLLALVLDARGPTLRGGPGDLGQVDRLAPVAAPPHRVTEERGGLHGAPDRLGEDLEGGDVEVALDAALVEHLDLLPRALRDARHHDLRAGVAGLHDV